MPVDGERLKRVLDHKLVTVRHLEEENARIRAELAAARQVAAGYETDVEDVDGERFLAWSERDKAVAELAAERERAAVSLANELNALDRAKKAEASVAKLREALEPFAARLDEVEQLKASKYADGTNIDIKHLRRARAVLEETGGGNE